MWGVSRKLSNSNNYTPLKKATLFIGISALFITKITRSFYRLFIYQHNINDWYIADTFGNSFETIIAIFIILTLSGSGTLKDWKIIVIIIAGLVCYECFHLTGHHSIDLHDLIATQIFGALSSVIYIVIASKYNQNII